jgi:hypothetical protein
VASSALATPKPLRRAPPGHNRNVAGQQRYFDPSQPQTLQIATILLYIQAVFALLGFRLLIAVACAAGAFGMANGKKWGYGLSIAVAAFELFFLLAGGLDFTVQAISLMFAIALLALLVHPQSREYQRIWFS